MENKEQIPLEARIFELNVTAEECRLESAYGLERIKQAIHDEKCKFLSNCERIIRLARSQGEYDLSIDIQGVILTRDFVYVPQYIDEVMEILRKKGFTVVYNKRMTGGDYLYISWSLTDNQTLSTKNIHS